MTRSSIVLVSITFAAVARAQPAPGDANLEAPTNASTPAPNATPPAAPPDATAPAAPPNATLPFGPPGALPPLPATEPPTEPPPVAPQPMKSICLEGRPTCMTTFLLEGSGRGGNATVGVLDLGLLVTHDHDAFGATIGWMSFRRGAAIATSSAYKARYRRYLGEDGFAVDLGVGGGHYGVSGEVAIGYRDIIALTAGVETLPHELGARGGAGIGIRLGTEGLALLVYALASLAGGGGH
jgi:hypothetical protein